MANKFCYNIAISRVQYSLRIRSKFYFISVKNKARIYTVDGGLTGNLDVKVPDLNRPSYFHSAVQVKQDLYVYSNCDLYHLQNIQSERNKMTWTIKKSYDTEMKYGVCLLNFYDRFLFIFRGHHGSFCVNYKTVLRYSIAEDKYLVAPTLNRVKLSIAGCVLNDFIYVFSG